MAVLSRKGARGTSLYETGRRSGPAVLVLKGARDGSTPPPEEVLDSLAAEGEAQLTGDITLSAGAGITLTQVGNDIEISA